MFECLRNTVSFEPWVFDSTVKSNTSSMFTCKWSFIILKYCSIKHFHHLVSTWYIWWTICFEGHLSSDLNNRLLGTIKLAFTLVYFGYETYEILRLASVDLYFKEQIQTFLLSILKKLLILGSSAPSHLVWDYWDLEQIFGILLKAFRYILLHDLM